MQTKMHAIQLCHIRSWHARMRLQAIMDMPSVYTRAMNDRFDIINLAYLHTLNEKHVMWSPCHMLVLSSLNSALATVCCWKRIGESKIH